jgi:hypothetical protein
LVQKQEMQLLGRVRMKNIFFLPFKRNDIGRIFISYERAPGPGGLPIYANAYSRMKF